MAQQDVPPYQRPVYIAPVAIGLQVAQAESAKPNSVLRTGYINPPGATVQQWNIDPSDISKQEFFVKLNSDSTLVLQSPVEDGASAFIATQGDRYRNGGIQVWIFQKIGSDTWQLKNFKTGMYLYLDYDGHGHGEPGNRILTRTSTAGSFQNTDWKITLV